jgi:diguanylate cyclase (GGDEF)-like protein
MINAVRHDRSLASAVKGWAIWELPRWLSVFVIFVISATAGATVFAAVHTQLHAANVELFAVLLACSMVTVELTRRAGEPGGAIKDVYGVWNLPVALLLPPVYALIAILPRLLVIQWRVRKTVMYRRVFSAAAVGLSWAAASVTFHAAVPMITPASSGAVNHALAWTLIATGCGLLRFAVNYVIVLTAIKGSEPSVRLKPMVFAREPLYNDLAELCVGVLVAFSAAHNPVLAFYALPLIILLQRSMRHAQLLDASRIDGKTGLLNAATWQREAALQVTRAARTRTPLAVAMLDIDYFKNVNDTYGHLAGDAVLATLASTLRALLREYDLTGRFGGEEFAILLPQTGEAEAAQIAERLRERVSRITFPVTGGPDAEPLRITVSLGIATLDRSRRSLDELIAAADHALYQAKNSGRDRVCITSDTSAEA